MKGRDKYPDVIKRFRLRPDMVHSMSTHRFMFIELMVPCELRMEGQHMYKVVEYKGLVADRRDDGYTGRFFSVEMGARGLHVCIRCNEASRAEMDSEKRGFEKAM